MQRYIFELTSNDQFIDDNNIIYIDSFVPISDDSVAIDGYNQDGDAYFKVFDLNDVVSMA